MSVAESQIHTLYADHQHWLRTLLTRRLRCAETAADLSQDVFVRLLGRPLPALQEPRAYLAHIAHGLVVDHHRRREIERAWLETLAALPEAMTPSLEEQLVIVDALARIDALLDGLKPRVRQVFLLSRLEEMSYPAIAALLDVSLSTVEKDMAQALRHCYALLMG